MRDTIETLAWIVVLSIASIIIGATIAMAQQASPQEQALSQKLVAELQSGLVCSAAVIDASVKIKALEAQVAELTKKAEGK